MDVVDVIPRVDDARPSQLESDNTDVLQTLTKLKISLDWCVGDDRSFTKDPEWEVGTLVPALSVK